MKSSLCGTTLRLKFSRKLIKYCLNLTEKLVKRIKSGISIKSLWIEMSLTKLSQKV